MLGDDSRYLGGDADGGMRVVSFAAARLFQDPAARYLLA